MNAIKNITIGHIERLYKPVGYTMLANLVNIVPFCLPPVVDIRHYGCLYAGHGFGRTGILPSQF